MKGRSTVRNALIVIILGAGFGAAVAQDPVCQIWADFLDSEAEEIAWQAYCAAALGDWEVNPERVSRWSAADELPGDTVWRTTAAQTDEQAGQRWLFLFLRGHSRPGRSAARQAPPTVPYIGVECSSNDAPRPFIHLITTDPCCPPFLFPLPEDNPGLVDVVWYSLPGDFSAIWDEWEYRQPMGDTIITNIRLNAHAFEAMKASEFFEISFEEYHGVHTYTFEVAGLRELLSQTPLCRS